jgi:hypothetical protein
VSVTKRRKMMSECRSVNISTLKCLLSFQTQKPLFQIRISAFIMTVPTEWSPIHCALFGAVYKINAFLDIFETPFQKCYTHLNAVFISNRVITRRVHTCLIQIKIR